MFLRRRIEKLRLIVDLEVFLEKKWLKFKENEFYRVENLDLMVMLKIPDIKNNTRKRRDRSRKNRRKKSSSKYL